MGTENNTLDRIQEKAKNDEVGNRKTETKKGLEKLNQKKAKIWQGSEKA